MSFRTHGGNKGFRGDNGPAKGTAIKMVLGLVKPTAGKALVLGESAHHDGRLRAWLRYMPALDRLPSLASTAEFFMHMAELSELLPPPSPSAAGTRAADTLRHVGLFERYRGARCQFSDVKSPGKSCSMLCAKTPQRSLRGRQSWINLLIRQD